MIHNPWRPCCSLVSVFHWLWQLAWITWAAPDSSWMTECFRWPILTVTSLRDRQSTWLRSAGGGEVVIYCELRGPALCEFSRCTLTLVMSLLRHPPPPTHMPLQPQAFAGHAGKPLISPEHWQHADTSGRGQRWHISYLPRSGILPVLFTMCP